MSFSYYFDEPFLINSQTQLYAEPNKLVDTNIYDYIITFNTMFDTFFNSKTYKQDPQSPNNVDIDFSISSNEYINIYQNTKMQPTETNAYIYGSMDTIDFSTRILEILALKIFGHAKARAAINNDTDIVNGLQNDLYNHIGSMLDRHKHNIYNMYVYQDLQDLKQDDVDSPPNFNFNYDKIAFPGYIKGSLSNKNLLSSSLMNGPVHGINSVVNGDYNIPILLMISDNYIDNNNNNNNQPPNYDYTIILMTYDDNGYVTYIAFDAASVYIK